LVLTPIFSFFSFESAGIRPDIVLLSKAISGLGLPMSMLLLSPELDQWNPGEHSGTFRGNNLAFVTATVALDNWQDGSFTDRIHQNSQILANGLNAIQRRYPAITSAVRGVGMIYGLEFQSPSDAHYVARKAFTNGLVVELCGPRSSVLKFLPPLNIDTGLLQQGLDLVDRCIEILSEDSIIT
jgi:diaminobutyrate-2-oxoglutarate transaminase